MEHRLSKRVPVDMEVTLRHQRAQILKGKARNLSDEGMYIVTGEECLPRGTSVEVEINDRSSTRLGRRLQGIVVHCNNHGVGVMLAERPALFE